MIDDTFGGVFARPAGFSFWFVSALWRRGRRGRLIDYSNETQRPKERAESSLADAHHQHASCQLYSARTITRLWP
jgi:hypothetical protein